MCILALADLRCRVGAGGRVRGGGAVLLIGMRGPGGFTGQVRRLPWVRGYYVMALCYNNDGSLRFWLSCGALSFAAYSIR